MPVQEEIIATQKLSEREELLKRLKTAQKSLEKLYPADVEVQILKMKVMFFEHLKDRLQQIIQDLGRIDLSDAITDFRWLIARSGLAISDLGLDGVWFDELRKFNRH